MRSSFFSKKNNNKNKKEEEEENVEEETTGNTDNNIVLDGKGPKRQEDEEEVPVILKEEELVENLEEVGLGDNNNNNINDNDGDDNQDDDDAVLAPETQSSLTQLPPQQCLFNQMKIFEFKRQNKFVKPQLHRLQKTWKQWKQNIKIFNEETEYAIQLIYHTLETSTQFTNILNVIHQDCFVNDKLEQVIDITATTNTTKLTRQQQILATQRSELLDSFDASLKTGDTSVSIPYRSFSRMTETLLKRIPPKRETTLKIVQRDLLTFQEDSKLQLEALESLGDSIIHDLDQAEQEIEIIYNAMIQMDEQQQKNKNVKNNTTTNRDSLIGSIASRFGIHWSGKTTMELKSGQTISLGDWWLLITLYQNSVHNEYYNVWDEGQIKMESVLESLENYQRYHNDKLQEILQIVIPGHTQLFYIDNKAFKPIARSVSFDSHDEDKIKSYDEDTTDDSDSDNDSDESDDSSLEPEDIDLIIKAFDETIQKRSNAFLRAKTIHKSSIMNRSSAIYNPEIMKQVPWLHLATTKNDRETLLSFGNPLSSQLVQKAMVVEQWVHREFSTVFCVLTLDRYFHMFEAADFDPSFPPERVFSALCKNSVYTLAPLKAARQKQKNDYEYVTKRKWRASARTNISILKPICSFNLKKSTYSSAKYALKTFDIIQEDHSDNNSTVKSAKLRFSTYNDCSICLLMMKWGYDQKMAEQHMAKAKATVLAKKRKGERQAKRKQLKAQQKRPGGGGGIPQKNLETIKENPAAKVLASLRMDFLSEESTRHEVSESEETVNLVPPVSNKENQSETNTSTIPADGNEDQASEVSPSSEVVNNEISVDKAKSLSESATSTAAIMSASQDDETKNVSTISQLIDSSTEKIEKLDTATEVEC